MKKMLSLIMMLCMLVCVMLGSALAEGPVLVPRTNEAGEAILAVIYDAQGNVIAQVKDDGTLTLSDDHAAPSARLAAAYEDVLKELHPSDMTSAEEGRSLKADIDALLADLGITGYDLVIFALVDIELGEQVAALLTDGAVAEVTIEIPGAAAPLVSLFSADGSTWQVIPTVSSGSAITVKLPASGTLALLANGRGEDGIGIGEPSEPQTNENPSVTGTIAPQPVPFVEDETEYVATIHGEDAQGVLNLNYVIVTGVAQRSDVLDLRTYVRLDQAYNNILDTENVGNLPVGGEQTLASQLSSSELVVRDLFEVTAYGEYLDALAAEGSYLEVTLDANLDPAKSLEVIHSMDGVTWSALDADNVTVNTDGTVTLKLHDLGVLAFLVEAEYSVDAQDAVMAP